MGENEQDTDQAPEVRSLKAMLEYQDGSVVSRMLLKNTGGSTTLFAFDQGEGLSEHTAPFDALVQVVEGRLDLSIGTAEYSLGAGEIIRMPADVPHALHAPEEAKMLLTMLRQEKSED